VSAYQVEIDPLVLQRAAKLADDDRDGIRAVLDRLELLADEPRPAGAFRYGPDAVRLQIGLYRVMAEIDEATHVVRITHIGRS
jgi:mRNA interferase RelE/StbE